MYEKERKCMKKKENSFAHLVMSSGSKVMKKNFHAQLSSIIVGILTFRSRKNSILGLSEPEKEEFLDIFILMII